MEERKLGDGIARQELNLIFIIDKSGSMSGEKMGAVNNAIRDVMSIMPDIQQDTADADIKISALTFSQDAEWVYQEPKGVNEFRWTDVSASGETNLSLAYDKLSEKLAKKTNGGMMPDIGGLAPILILMTDGLPTSPDWENHLDILKKKGWFRVALRYALAIEIDCEEAMDVLVKFTGNPETVLKVYTAEALRKVIRVIAITASKVKSSSTTSHSGGLINANEEAKETIAEELSEVKNVEW